MDMMHCPIVRLTHSDGSEWYLAWVGACDAPTGYSMTYAELVQGLREEIDRDYQRSVDACHSCPDGVQEATIEREHKLGQMGRRLERLRRRGTTFLDPSYTAGSGEAFVKFNRAGPREGRLSVDKLIESRMRPSGATT